MADPVVTFDLFSALVDSRRGAGDVLARLGAERGWGHDGASVYDHWDGLTKQAHRECRTWVPHATLARDALATTYRELGLPGDPDEDLRALWSALPQWPLWPDVPELLPRVAERWRVGVLSNVDDALFDRTQVAPLVDRSLLLSSERLQAYKPDARIYRRAQERAGPLVHVATSARDVRGALEAGVPVVRLRRPGHRLDPAGPQPPVEADGLEQLAELLPRVARGLDMPARATGQTGPDASRGPDRTPGDETSTQESP